MFGWLEIGVKFIKKLAGGWDDRSGLNAPSKADNGSVEEGSASAADRSAARSKSEMSIKTEDWSNRQQELGHCDLTFGAESIVVRVDEAGAGISDPAAVAPRRCPSIADLDARPEPDAACRVPDWPAACPVAGPNVNRFGVIDPRLTGRGRRGFLNGGNWQAHERAAQL